MNKLLTLTFLFFSTIIFAQPATTANDVVPNYNTTFRLSVNPGYHGNNWTDEELAELAAGAPSLGIDGAGVRALRVPLPEEFLETYGYNIRVDAFNYYTTLGLIDNVVFLETPSPAHRDPEEYCPGSQSLMFKNMYAPIWDNGENGTPVNDTNYAALYVFKTVNLYKDNVKFWEIWNEPDLDYSGSGWLPPGAPGNWWENVPDPCDYKLQAPVFHYMRFLRISYEVVKTIDPDAFVTVGGLGFESFLDIVLRFTDNPVDGSVTSDYPLKGGAYFDALSYHSYPHINGSLRYWDNNCSCFVYTRHSDAAADGMIDHKNRFETVLTTHGYDGITYPEKITIVTETNVPSKPFGDQLGSFEAQRNFALKMIVKSYQEGIRHLAFYQLADIANYNQSNSWIESCGLYKKISSPPYNVNYNEEGTATRTMTELTFETTYDDARTQALNLPSNLDGGAFLKSTGEYIYVLWAKTETDQSETASGVYSFPASLGITSLDKRLWDFSATGTVENISPSNVDLTGDPTFFEESLSPLPVELLSFEAKKINDQVLLNWTTVSEDNNFGFEIEYSMDGEKWEVLDFIEGNGTSTLEKNYSYRHLEPQKGFNYYRLKQIDFDQEYSFSNIVSLEFNNISKRDYSIFPNPVVDKIYISNFRGVVKVYNMTGQLVIDLICKDKNMSSIDVRTLENGVYFLFLTDELGEKNNQIFIKQ